MTLPLFWIIQTPKSQLINQVLILKILFSTTMNIFSKKECSYKSKDLNRLKSL